MTQKTYKVFLDTSVIIAAIFSKTGGARKLFYLGEAGIITLLVGPNVLREADEVIRRKAPDSLPLLAQLLTLCQVNTAPAPNQSLLESARAYVCFSRDAHVLAEAPGAQPDWFVTHDKEHFLKEQILLPIVVGTPGDFIQHLKRESGLI